MIFLALLFAPLDDTIPDTPFSYVGKYQLREEIVVDPENSPLLTDAVTHLERQLRETFSEKEILEEIFFYVRTTLFDLSKCDEGHLIPLLHQREIAPLELFLEKKIGVCRHIALTTSYLVDQLSKRGWLKGQTYFIREDLPTSRHAWTLFVSETEVWHLDPYWGILERGATPEGVSRLSMYYTAEVIENLKNQYFSNCKY